MNKYNEEYYKSDNYKTYLLKGDRYHKLAIELTDLLKKIGLIKSKDYILDYGCSVGFFLQGLSKLGYTNVYGYDVSSWATEEAVKNQVKILYINPNLGKFTFDIITFFDVLEHMDDSEIQLLLTKYFYSKVVIVRIPVSVDGTKFYLEISNNDPTHINCKNKEQWKDLFKNLGYNIFLPLDLLTIYDSPGVMAGIFIKE